MPSGAPATATTLAELRQGFRTPSPDARPMMRWWWFGPAMDRDEIDRELQAMRDGGIGGVEVSNVYPLSVDSPTLLSPEFCDHLRYAADRSRELGLRFDLTLGTGWSYGGPHISTELAASLVHWDRREISLAGFTFRPDTSFPGDQLLAAFVTNGGGGERATECAELDIEDGTITVPEGFGPRELLLAYARPTGQLVKRASAGAEGPVLDHYSAAATQAHLTHVGEPLLDAVPAELIGSVFCDSLEVYAANWTPAMFAEFEQRRGYPLRPRLHQLITKTPDADQLRRDYHRTLTELYEENFVIPIQQWAARKGVRFRIQGYGVPPAAINSYRYADLYEGEGWGWKEITQTRWATSAAHLLNQPVVSSETWTWNHSPSFRSTALDLKGEAHEHLLAGINQFIGHGWPYSPPQARESGGLGWFFYAAGAFDDRNPWWPAMPALMGYLQRLCWLMRQGRPVADVLVYVPQDDIYPLLGRESGGNLDLWKRTRQTLDPAIIANLREGGWDYDLVDDALLTDLDVDHVPVLLLPGAEHIPAATQGWLDRYRAAGGTVLAVGGDGYPAARPCASSSLADELTAVIAPDLGIDPQPGDVASVHRHLPEADLHLVINTGPHPRRFTATPRTDRGHVELWDPDHARLVAAGAFTGSVEVELEPYQAIVIILTDEAHTAAPNPSPSPVDALPLTGDWRVSFNGEESAPVTLPHRWEDDPSRASFSGTACYQVDVELDDSWGSSDRVLLDFGSSRPGEVEPLPQDRVRSNSYRAELTAPVGEVARVIVNDQDCGVVWAPPYAVDVSAAVNPGRNQIRVEVSNTAANALSSDPGIGKLVEEARRHYGQRFTMQDLDLALYGVNSGLHETPVLRH